MLTRLDKAVRWQRCFDQAIYQLSLTSMQTRATTTVLYQTQTCSRNVLPSSARPTVPSLRRSCRAPRPSDKTSTSQFRSRACLPSCRRPKCGRTAKRSRLTLYSSMLIITPYQPTSIRFTFQITQYLFTNEMWQNGVSLKRNVTYSTAYCTITIR